MSDNQSNAYVSGLKEDLGLYGNELNFLTTYFKCFAKCAAGTIADELRIGYVFMLFPTVFIIARFGPGYWLPACEVRLLSRLFRRDC